MKDFLLIFRNDFTAPTAPTPEQMQGMMKLWMDWIGGIAAQNKLTDKGNRLGFGGKVVRSNDFVTDGPFADLKEIVSGYIIVKAENFDEAAEMSKGCPILNIGGSVEVREVIAM